MSGVRKDYCPFKYQNCRPGCMAFVETVHPDTGETIGFCSVIAGAAAQINLAFGDDTVSIRYVSVPVNDGCENKAEDDG